MRVRAWMGASAVLALYALVQTAWLPADGFMAGDQGTKYLQVRGALAHGPLTPWIDGLSLDLDADMRYQEPLMVRNGRRLVGIFPWILPALTAPFYKILGLQGLYVIPAISVAIIFLAACRLGRQCRLMGDGVASGLCVVFATPVVFYGAELWEHAPAIALTTVAATLVVSRDGEQRRNLVRAGACVGLAAAFRPEALVIAPAFVLARGWVYGFDRVPRELAWLGGAALSAYGIIGLGNLSVYGAFVPQHVAANMVQSGTYLAVRREVLSVFLLPARYQGLFAIAAFALLAAIMLPSRVAARIWLAHLAFAVMLAVAIGIPAWTSFVRHERFLDALDYRSLVHTWPFAFTLIYWIWRRRHSAGAEVERMLFATSVLYAVGSLLTMPHTGGAQWSARFLLPAAPFLGVLASRLLVDPGFTLPRFHARLANVACAVALASSIAVEAYGLSFLRDAKRLNADLTAKIAELTDPGAVIVSDVFWVPEVSAMLYPTRRYMFAWSPDDVPAIATRAAQFGITQLNVVSSPPITHYTPPTELVVPGGSAYRWRELRDLSQRGLFLHRYVLAAPPR